MTSNRGRVAWRGWLRAGAIAIVAAWLSGCGGGGGGDPPVEELPVTLGLPGPGDAENYFPLALDNLWHFRGSVTADGSSVAFETVATVVGTQVVSGLPAFLLRETSPEAGAAAVEQLLVKDANGIVVWDEDAGDGPDFTPYWDARFPLQPGTEFVQLDRRGLDAGEDLDGDGRHETVDVRSVVRMLGFESVTVPAGHFTDAAHLRRDLQLTIRLTSTGETVLATELGDLWLARGVGWVRRSSSLTMLGTVVSTDEQLDAYVVGGVAVGLNEAPGAVVAGAVAAGASDLWLFRDRLPARYSAALTGLSGDADLTVLSATGCVRGSGALPGTVPEDCSFDLASGRQVVLRVRGVDAARYLLALAGTPAYATLIDETASIAAGAPVPGRVGARGESDYSVSGLAPGAYHIALFGLSGDADLKVYFDDTYSMEQDCTLRAPGDLLPTPDDCGTTSGGSLYFSVRSGELNPDGASYLILVHPSP